jgi:hypothetical protein
MIKDTGEENKELRKIRDKEHHELYESSKTTD